MEPSWGPPHPHPHHHQTSSHLLQSRLESIRPTCPLSGRWHVDVGRDLRAGSLSHPHSSAVHSQQEAKELTAQGAKHKALQPAKPAQ